MRVMFARLLLIAIPFVVWFAYRWWVKRRGLAVPNTPYVWLFLTGVALMTGSLFLTALTSPDHREGVYVPAEALPDGRIVPERYETR
jgi:drug/metabolite transporter (DMT)-like permease